MPKAVKITEDNKDNITAQYKMDPGSLDDMVGLFLVADFGAEAVTYGYLTQKGLDNSFRTPGINLQNGFFEVILRH